MSNSSAMSVLKAATAPIYFGSFIVTPQVFLQTPLTFALATSSSPPRRVVPRFADLTPAETSDLFVTVRRVGRMVERVYGASSLNIAVQDGVHAGQSVPHVHAHVIPRKAADLDHFGGTDAVYDLLDGEEGDLGKIYRDAEAGTLADGMVKTYEAAASRPRRRSGFHAVDNEGRMPRSEEEMRVEAEMLAREMETEPID
ncbi:hypothetical protein N7499_013122 [Penicillium canescens]|nr:hypothetical protein N7499_013122 [Penicillium canescens]